MWHVARMGLGGGRNWYELWWERPKVKGPRSGAYVGLIGRA